MDIERRAAQKAFDVREFEACHLEAEETSARPDAPGLRSRPRAVNLSGFSREVDPLGRARPRGGFKPVSVLRAFGPVAAQALGSHRGGDEEEKAGKGVPDAEEVGGAEEDSAAAPGTGLSVPPGASPPWGPGQVFVLSAKSVLTVGHFFADPATLNQSALP